MSYDLKKTAKYNTQTTTVPLFYGDLCPAHKISEILKSRGKSRKEQTDYSDVTSEVLTSMIMSIYFCSDMTRWTLADSRT